MSKLSVKGPREAMTKIQNKIDEMPGVMHGNCFPLEHKFGDGLYVREIFMPKGMLIVSKIHKFTHPYFVLKGKCSVLTEEGIIRIQAPFYGMTKAGTKRILYIHEDSVWVTVHATEEKDVEKIEEHIVTTDFKDLDAIETKEEAGRIHDFLQNLIEEQKDEPKTSPILRV